MRLKWRRRWTRIAWLATSATGLCLIVTKLGYDRIIACEAWLDRSPLGDITKTAVQNCVDETTTTVRISAGIAFASTCALAVALANLAGLTED